MIDVFGDGKYVFESIDDLPVVITKECGCVYNRIDSSTAYQLVSICNTHYQEKRIEKEEINSRQRKFEIQRLIEQKKLEILTRMALEELVNDGIVSEEEASEYLNSL